MKKMKRRYTRSERMDLISLPDFLLWFWIKMIFAFLIYYVMRLLKMRAQATPELLALSKR